MTARNGLKKTQFQIVIPKGCRPLALINTCALSDTQNLNEVCVNGLHGFP